jgi:drug/metabolite transporter (DMT)-like permease
VLQLEGPRAQPERSSWLIVASLVAVYIIWGTTFFGIKVCVRTMPPFFIVGTRYLTAGTVLLGLQCLRGRKLPALRQWPSVALLGLLMLVVGNGTACFAEERISSGAAVAFLSVMPVTTALWSGVFGRWPRRSEWWAIGIGSIGAALMVMGRDLSTSLEGTLLLLTGTTSWSLGTVLARRLDVPSGPSGFGAEMLCAGVIGMGLSALRGEHWTLDYSGGTWAAWAYLVTFGSLIAFSAYRYLVENVSPTLASTYAYVNPPVALLVGAWLGSETFSGLLFLGLPIVLVAVAMLAWSHARAAATPVAAS